MTAHHIHTTVILCCWSLLVANATACSRTGAPGTPAAEEGASFRGVYESGPDRSVFIPCGTDERWYVWPSSVAARELRRLTNAQDLQSPGGGMASKARSPDVRRAYAEVLGDTVAVTKSQPALPYDLELRLTRVVEVRSAQGTVCP